MRRREMGKRKGEIKDTIKKIKTEINKLGKVFLKMGKGCGSAVAFFTRRYRALDPTALQKQTNQQINKTKKEPTTSSIKST